MCALMVTEEELDQLFTESVRWTLDSRNQKLITLKIITILSQSCGYHYIMWSPQITYSGNLLPVKIFAKVAVMRNVEKGKKEDEQDRNFCLIFLTLLKISGTNR